MSFDCKKCGKANREPAKYCKQCGTALDRGTKANAADGWDALVGLEDLKAAIAGKLVLARAMATGGDVFQKRLLHTVIVGNAGTGKKSIVRQLASLYFSHGITTRPDAKTVESVEFAAFAKDMTASLSAAKGGIVYFKDAHRLLPSAYQAGMSTQLDKLLTELDRMKGDPIVILGALPDGFRDFLDQGPDVKKRFPQVFKLPDLTAAEMFEIARRYFECKGWKIGDGAAKKLKNRFKMIIRKKDDALPNGHAVQAELDEITGKHYVNPRYAEFPREMLEEDIQRAVYEERTIEQLIAQMDRDFVGMSAIKSRIKRLVAQIKQASKDSTRTGKEHLFSEHAIITGNPGTGKTVVARTLGDVFAAIGLLEGGHVVEVDRGKLVADHVGGTAKLVHKACDQAMGGVLFVDEAYMLKQDERDQWGQEAIDTLMKRMEDDRGKFVLIIAGYRARMTAFIDSNPGIRSRFSPENNFHIDDYKPDELVSIFKLTASKEGFSLDVGVEQLVKARMEAMYEQRDASFGNGRDVRTFYNACMELRSARMGRMTEEIGQTQAGTTEAGADNKKPDGEMEEHRNEETGSCEQLLRKEDIPGDLRDYLAAEFNAAMTELNGLVGLARVKTEITKLVALQTVEKARAAQGGPRTRLNLHFAFKGRPGTGKTHVARILARVFKSLGLLSKGNLVEVDRGKLVADHVGGTAKLVHKACDQAMGGVLFVDEAYMLKQDERDQWGQEAIDTLMKRMEDDRGKFFVIAAGYTEHMDRFLGSNPGLQSRFTKHIVFDDYTPDELVKIFIKLVRDKGLSMAEGADAVLHGVIDHIYRTRDDRFANARAIRNLFEVTVLPNQATRLATENEKGNDISLLLNIITKEDICLPEASA